MSPEGRTVSGSAKPAHMTRDPHVTTMKRRGGRREEGAMDLEGRRGRASEEEGRWRGGRGGPGGRGAWAGGVGRTWARLRAEAMMRGTRRLRPRSLLRLPPEDGGAH
eukprot:429461-Rhodomonas_salina.1